MIAAVILLIAAVFVMLAAIGLLRMPDLYTKMHAVSKAGAFGGTIFLLLALVSFGWSVFFIVLANIIFFYFTTPIAAQMLAHAAIKQKNDVWGKTSMEDIDFE